MPVADSEEGDTLLNSYPAPPPAHFPPPQIPVQLTGYGSSADLVVSKLTVKGQNYSGKERGLGSGPSLLG